MMNFLTRDKDLMLFGLNESEHSQKGALAFIFVYLFATIFGAILTPLLYWLTEYVNSLYPTNETLIYLLDKGIDKYFDRIRWLGIIIGLPFVFKYCGFTSFESMGLSMNKKVAFSFLKYFVLGFCVMLFIYCMQFAFTDMGVKDIALASLPLIFLKAAMSGFILGFLEELIFRGLIFRCFYTAWGVLPAMLFSSLFFAYKHFKVPNCLWDKIDLHSASWYSGFEVAYYDSVGIFINFQALAFCSLAILALFLCVLYMKSKTLYVPMAFHAALVFALQLHRKFFIVKEDDLRNFFGNAGAINSYIAVIILSILLIFSILNFKKRSLIR